MKKLNLDETWRLCLEMWKWIAGEAGALFVPILKEQWLREHGYEDRLQADCFFCDYSKGRGCLPCPGKEVDEAFDCTCTDYDYCDNPIKFYNKLVSLNEIRLKK